MNIVFFGTSLFGIPSLEALLGSKHRLSAVVTTPDKPSGRHLKLTSSPVKQWAISRGIGVLEADKSNIVLIGEQLMKESVDVFVVISFGVILPQRVLSVPKLIAINVHSSLLPRYRGPAPIHWAILNGDTKTGVTVMRMMASLDTGDIVLQETLPIMPEDSALSLHDRLSGMAAPLLLHALSLIEEKKAVYTPQEESSATYARKIIKEDGRLFWTVQTAREIERKVRALSGWPGAYTFINGKRIIVRKASVVDGPQGLPGHVLKADRREGLLIAAKEGAICIEELQAEGRKPMTATDFLQGFPLRIGDVVE